jgi:hypothetical protein
VKNITYEKAEATLLGLAGFAFKHMGIPSSQVSVALVEDPHMVVRFVSFSIARGVVAGTVIKHISNIRKALAWRASRGGDIVTSNHRQAVAAWLDVVQRQVKNVAQPSQQPARIANLPSAANVLRWQVKVEEIAIEERAKDIAEWGTMTRTDAATATQNAAQLALMFGYLPPLRLACIRTCLHPDAVAAGTMCSDAECTLGTNCKGNR